MAPVWQVGQALWSGRGRGCVLIDWHFYVQAAIAMFMITAPIDPVKILFFNTTIEQQGRKRSPAALFVAGVVFAILAGAALVGRQLLELLGINLDAFSVVGGLVIAGMGFDMLNGGKPTRAQGRETAEEGPSEESGLIMPLSIPLIAGPGAIVTIITITSQEDSADTIFAALIGAAVVGLGAFIAFNFLGDLISRAKPTTTALLVRIGGLLLATIGTQMFLGGLKNFFAA